MIRRSSTLLAALLAGGGVVLGACGSDRADGFTPEDGAPTFNDDAGGPATNDASSACVAQTVLAEPLSLSMLIVMDRSESMLGTKWPAATSAMISFADGAGAVGTQLGLSVFPPDAPATNACDVDLFAPIVPIGPLPANSSPIKNALLSRGPEGATPMGQAIVAAHKAMKAHVDANVNVQGVLILVTDGQPTGCGSSVPEVTLSIKAAAKDLVRTFVVGMDGADFPTLDAFAVDGQGTTKAFNAAGATGDVQTSILDALDAVRATAIGCEFVVPTPSSELGTLDPASVEVELSKGSDPKQTFRKVAGKDACGLTAGGFYYDDPTTPHRVILCPASCDVVKSAGRNAKVDLHLGCIRQVR
jgi:von Willebrand factor type A domain